MANVQRLQQLLKTVTAFSDNFTYRCTLAIITDCPVGPKPQYHKDASWTGPTTSNFETALKLLVQDNTIHTCGSCGCMIGFTNALQLESCKVNSFDSEYDSLDSISVEQAFYCEGHASTTWTDERRTTINNLRESLSLEPI